MVDHKHRTCNQIVTLLISIDSDVSIITTDSYISNAAASNKKGQIGQIKVRGSIRKNTPVENKVLTNRSRYETNLIV